MAQQLIIDLSATGGLAPKFWGDSDQTVATPNTSYFSEANAYADGFFNPWMRAGYTSPAVASLTTTTTDQAFGATPSFAVYDDINDDLYVAENGRQLFRLDGLDDTSFTRIFNLSGTVGSPAFQDLEIYQINGVRYLFGLYTRSFDTFTASATTNSITMTSAWAINGAAVTVSSTGSVPAGLTPGTTYYMVNVSGAVCQLAATPGGAIIDLTDSGSGTMTITGQLGNIYGKNLVDSSTNEKVLSGVTNPLQMVGGRPMMRVADNGFMYLLDGYAVHKFDGTTKGGTTGTVSANVLLFPPHFNIVDGLDYRGLMFICVHQTTASNITAHSDGRNYAIPCGIYIWDRQTTTVSTRDYISLGGVKAIRKIYVSPDGHIRLICIAANGLTQMREYDGSRFVVIKELGLAASPQYQDSLHVTTSHTLWLGNDGTIYCHGKINPGDPEILAKIGYVKAPTSSPASTLTGAGCVFYGAANSFSGTPGYRVDRQGLLIGYNDNGTYAAVKFFPFDKGTIDATAQTALAGNIYTGLQFLPTMSTIHHINLSMATGTSTGSSVQGSVAIYFNGSATAWATKNITRDDISRGYKRIEVNKQYVNSIQLKISYAADTTLGDAFDFHPAFAVVSYDPTTTKG